MGRTILTEEQKELIALIPKAIRNSKDFTNAAKLVLAQLDLQDGTDFSETNHYVFSSNDDLMKNTGIASKHTVINAVKQLVNEGLIETKRGYRRKGDIKASEYVLTDKYYELGDRENPHKQGCNKGCNKNEQGCNKGCNKNEQGCNKGCNCTNSTNTVIEDMQQQINELREEIEKLQNALKKINCTSDTDTDIELEKELNINQTIVHVTEDKNENTMNDMKINQTNIYENPVDLLYDDEINEVLKQEPDSEEEERIRKDYINSINNGSINNKSQIRSIDNDYVSWVFDKYDYFLDKLFKARSREMYKYYEERLIKLTHSLQKEKFTEPQWNVVLKKFNRWEGIEKCNRYSGMAVPNYNSSIEETNDTPTPQTTDMLTNEDIMRAYMTEEELAQYGVISTVEEPMVAYCNNSLKEAQEQFAMALAANG